MAPWGQEPSPSSADSSWGKPEGLESMGWRAGTQDLRCRAGKRATTVVRRGISAGRAGGAPLRVCCSIAARVGAPPCASGQARRVQARFAGMWASELQWHMAVVAAELQLRVMARVAGGGRREECARLADGGCRAECERRSNAGSYSGIALDPAQGSSLSLSLSLHEAGADELGRGTAGYWQGPRRHAGRQHRGLGGGEALGLGCRPELPTMAQGAGAAPRP